MDNQQIGSWAFILGVVVAILAALLVWVQAAVPGMEYVPLVLVVLGLAVGFLNVNDKEVNEFLLAAIALIVVAIPAGSLLTIPYVGEIIMKILQYIAVFVAPAVLIVSIKAVYRLSKAPVLAK